jgi:hypothetical protein
MYHTKFRKLFKSKQLKIQLDNLNYIAQYEFNLRASLLGKNERKREKNRGLENVYLRITVNKSRQVRQQSYMAVGKKINTKYEPKYLKEIIQKA